MFSMNSWHSPHKSNTLRLPFPFPKNLLGKTWCLDNPRICRQRGQTPIVQLRSLPIISPFSLLKDQKVNFFFKLQPNFRLSFFRKIAIESCAHKNPLDTDFLCAEGRVRSRITKFFVRASHSKKTKCSRPRLIVTPCSRNIFRLSNPPESQAVGFLPHTKIRLTRIFSVLRGGFEPPTLRSSGECSTN